MDKSPTEGAVQLRGAGAVCAGQPSVADLKIHGRRRPNEAVGDLRRILQPYGHAIGLASATVVGCERRTECRC